MSNPLSYSRLWAFMQCPAMYQFRREHRPQSDLPAIMIRGKYAHAFYEVYVNKCCTSNAMQLLDQIDLTAYVAYNAACIDSIQSGSPVLSPHEWNDVVKKLCRPWAERTAVPVENIYETELRWALDIHGDAVDFNDDDAFMRGVIDRWENTDTGIRLIDYKTGYGGTGDPMQADIYAWATMLLTDTHAVTVVFEHTATDYCETYEYTRDDLKTLDDSIRALADTVLNTTEFKPTPGVACLECPYRYCCDAKADVQEAVETEADARRTIEALALLERDVKTCKEGLRRYCETYGNVEHNGITWGIWKSDGTGFHDAEAFVSVCQAAGIEPYPFMSVNNTKAKRLQKQFPDIVSDNPSLSFRSKKTKGE